MAKPHPRRTIGLDRLSELRRKRLSQTIGDMVASSVCGPAGFYAAILYGA
jgi:hypothetical protein